MVGEGLGSKFCTTQHFPHEIKPSREWRFLDTSKTGVGIPLNLLFSLSIMSEPRAITVLVIGPSQNGKSTFVNRLVSLSVKSAPLAKEGDGNFKCTNDCTVYDLEVPLTDYKLVEIEGGRDYEVPSVEEEEKILAGAWWKKQTKSRLAIKQRQSRGPLIRLKLIDTPGLDDSEGKDYDNMEHVLGMLNELAQSPNEEDRGINALALVYNANGAFSYSFQKTMKDYERSMPNLFGGLAVINTNFSVTALAQKRQHLIREHLLGTSETAKDRVVKERRAEFFRILGRNPAHFFIDNKPNSKYMYDELVSCNTISDVLNFWANSKPMEIGQMRLVKNESMKAADKRLQSFLNFAIGVWDTEKRELLKDVSKGEALRSHFEQQHQELSDDISRITSDLERYDNDSEYTIQTHTTTDDETAPMLLLKWAFRVKKKNSYHIKEPDYDDYNVEPQNGMNSKWTSHSFDHVTNSWTGDYEAKPGKIPYLTARSYTTNRVYHRDAISSLRSQLRRARASLAENESNATIYAQEGDLNPRLETLVAWITSSKDLVELLGADSPPIDTSFDEAARRRYQKPPNTISHDDLLDMVKVAKPEVEAPLRMILMGVA